MKKGFTLIEMLIVVVIIGILASALIPRISSAKDRAQNTAAVKDVSDIVTALTIYQIDNGGYPVSASCNGTIKTDCTLSGVYTELSSYLKSIPQGNSKVPQWTIGNGNIVPAGNAYGYIGIGQRYILSYWFTDTRDGQRYKAVRMPDEKWWMAENLNFKTPNSSCYDDIDANCENNYGRLYTWDDAMTACPLGWKLPSDDEWTIMLNRVEEIYGGIQNHSRGWNIRNGSAIVGGSLQSVKTGSIGTDLFGFSILEAGYRNNSYNGINNRESLFQTATLYAGNSVWRHLYGGVSGIYFGVKHGARSQTFKSSVRCIQ